jgi:hypothetical protein
MREEREARGGMKPSRKKRNRLLDLAQTSLREDPLKIGRMG